MAGYYFGCPHCRAKLEARDASRAGRTVTCPKCEQALIIPSPPPMGVPLSQDAGQAPLQTASDDATQVVVSHDPGFKRVMSPAKAFNDESAPLPAPSHSGYDKLPPSEALQQPEANTLPASDDIEGYSFTVPDNDTDVAPPPAFVFKPKKKRSEAEEAPHPFEDPKNQLLALVGVVLAIVVIGAVWSWLSGDGQDEQQPAETSAPEVPPAAPQGTPQGLPGVPTPPPGVPEPAPDPFPAAKPGEPTTNPNPAEPAPSPANPPAELPDAVPDVLPETGDAAPPDAAPQPLPESTPNALPQANP